MEKVQEVLDGIQPPADVAAPAPKKNGVQNQEKPVSDVLREHGSPGADSSGSPASEEVEAEPGTEEDSEELSQDTEADSENADSDGDEPAVADTEPAPPPVRGPALRDELFTEEALATAEGVKAAREALQHHHREQRKKVRNLDKTIQRVERKKERAIQLNNALNQQVEGVRLERERFQNDLAVLWHPTTKPAEVLDTLARITRRDGAEIFNAMAEVVAGRAVQPKESAELKELRAKVEQMETERVTAVENTQLQQRVLQRKREIFDAGKNAEEYPHVAHILSTPKAAELIDIVVETKAQALEGKLVVNGKRWPRGIPLDDEQALQIMEEQLVNIPAVRQRVAQKAAGTGPESTTRASSPTPKIKSITPSLSNRNGARVEHEDGESVTSLAQDQDLLRSLGWRGQEA